MLCAMNMYFKTGTQEYLVCGGMWIFNVPYLGEYFREKLIVVSIYYREKLIVVSISMLSVSRNANIAIILRQLVSSTDITLVHMLLVNLLAYRSY